jgi:hypothetical protein
MLIRPMPSPNGTNREKLYVLQGGRGALNRRENYGMAFDARRGMAYDTLGAKPSDDNVNQLCSWIEENLSDEDRQRLIETLANRPAPAQDDDPVVDPMQTRGKAPGERLSMDAAAAKSLFGSVLKQAFAKPITPVAKYRAKEVRLAADAARVKSLGERVPGFGAIDVMPMESDPHARPHRLAHDGRTVASLEDRFPDLKKIGFA